MKPLPFGIPQWRRETNASPLTLAGEGSGERDRTPINADRTDVKNPLPPVVNTNK
jgi:hypothetical protein